MSNRIGPPEYFWRTPRGYAATHCMSCKAGWTRTGPEGSARVVCLLDREAVLADMVDCDRYASRRAADPE